MSDVTYPSISGGSSSDNKTIHVADVMEIFGRTFVLDLLRNGEMCAVGTAYEIIDADNKPKIVDIASKNIDIDRRYIGDGVPIDADEWKYGRFFKSNSAIKTSEMAYYYVSVSINDVNKALNLFNEIISEKDNLTLLEASVMVGGKTKLLANLRDGVIKAKGFLREDHALSDYTFGNAYDISLELWHKSDLRWHDNLITWAGENFGGARPYIDCIQILKPQTEHYPGKDRSGSTSTATQTAINDEHYPGKDSSGSTAIVSTKTDPRNGSGRKPTHDWDAIWTEAARRIFVDGKPEGVNEFARLMADWYHASFSQDIDESTLRKKFSPLFRALDAG